ncbi:hypothetical protein Tco_0973881 [Tanacetum coccineum]|uniref:Uncharacterized protein n=1 Tax=Tanacetum coccineum TaxID=301880 RepID=A0ABQ5EA15_9ASTR
MWVSHGDKTSRAYCCATGPEKVEGLCGIDEKEKMKKVVALRKKKSNNEMDAAARAAANEARQGMQVLQLLRRKRRTTTASTPCIKIADHDRRREEMRRAKAESVHVIRSADLVVLMGDHDDKSSVCHTSCIAKAA